MSILVNASGEFVYRTNVFTPQNPYTAMLWVFLDSFAGGDDSGVMRCHPIGGSFGHMDSVAYVQSTGKTALRVIVGSTPTIVNGSATITTGAWRHVALVREGTSSLKLYIDGALDATNTTNTSSWTLNQPLLAFGLSAGAGNRMEGRLANAKVWTRALSADEIIAEMNMARPVSFSSLWAWYPMWTHIDVADYSGNGRTLTADGSPTTEDNPPVSWGA